MSDGGVELYVLDKNLKMIYLVDAYESLIWANRYVKEGDCEVYIEATSENLKYLRKGYYLSRPDDDMVCRIEKVQLDTDAENGNYLIVTGYDAKKIVGQRVIWSTISVDGKVEDYIRQIISDNLTSPGMHARQIVNDAGQNMFYLWNKANFSEVTTEQVSYKNVAEKIQELCVKYGWGYKVVVNQSKFWFVLYRGTDRSDTVIFSDEFENIISTHYIEDKSQYRNVALVGGEGEGAERSRNVSGYAEGIDRYELFVDAKDISRSISYEQLTETYPDGSIYPQGATTDAYWRMDYVNIPEVDPEQFAEIKIRYPNGQVVTIDGNTYWQAYDVDIAVLHRDNPESNFDVRLLDVIYNTYLINRGYEKLAEFPSTVSFEGSIDPQTTFSYKRDYFLGDIVKVRNEFGIEAEARIVEILESWDENGYTVEPKYEYLSTEV